MMSTSNLVYIFELPATVIWELCGVLDPGNLWEDVAAAMPDICDVDIDACRRLRTGERPTEALLKIWGCMGYKIIDLYKVLYKVRYVRCMQFLLSYVDEKWHHFARNCAVAPPSLPASAAVVSAQSREDFNVYGNAKTPEVSKSASVVYSRRATLEASSRRINSGFENYPSLQNESNNAESSALLSGLQNTPAVRYEEILKATDNFSEKNILGRGGYGVVYRGMWQHLEVAIKRIQIRKDSSLAQQKESIRQSLQELRTLAKFRHDNVLSLYGYSMDGTEPCLVYQFMSNGSLEDRLLCRNGTKPMTWPIKFAICKGVTCGLHFLHSISNNPIIHGDVKSANILLDRHLEPKLGDFGLSHHGQIELSGEEKSPMIASHVKGTLAYLPPEFTTSKIITTKLDVYSFGVVLLEVAAGQRAYSSSRTPPNLVDYSCKVCGAANNDEARIREELSDKRTPQPEAEVSCAIFRKLLRLSTLCTQKDRFARPSFTEIFASLEELKFTN